MKFAFTGPETVASLFIYQKRVIIIKVINHSVLCHHLHASFVWILAPVAFIKCTVTDSRSARSPACGWPSCRQTEYVWLAKAPVSESSVSFNTVQLADVANLNSFQTVDI